MSVGRWMLAGGLGLLAGIPLLLPFLEAFGRVVLPNHDRLAIPFFEAIAEGVLPRADIRELASLAVNTLLLVGGSIAIALPFGILLAVLLFRTDLPARQFFVGAIIFALFVPLPLVVSAWQALVGSDGLVPLWFWGANADRPWSAGLLPAIWVHALAGLPWVILIVGVGLGAVETELEEEALLAAGPWRVLWRVTLARCQGAMAAAALWVAVLTAADITVTDVLLVPTFAEEIHTQFTMGGADALARTLLICLPGLGLIWVVLLLWLPRLERSLPPLQLSFGPQPVFALGKFRVLWLTVCLAAGAAIFLVPLWGLVWKVGLAGQPRAWSAAHASRQFLGELRLYGFQVFETLGVAFITGLMAALLALIACWSAREHRSFRLLLLGFVTLAWSLPAPVVGIGLKDTIMALVVRFPTSPLADLLYYGPSPVPVMWAQLLRFVPFAAAITWPAVRLVPQELVDAARLEGAAPWQELWHVYVPSTRRALQLSMAAVTALSLGEIGASARVETPQWETFAKLLFDRMHYGVDNNVAALALVLLAGIAATFVIVALARACLRALKKTRRQ